MSKDQPTKEEKHLFQRLKKALNSQDTTAFKRLIKGGVNVNAKFWFDSTLLHEAVTINDLDMVKTLLHYGAEVNAENKDGRTPLHLATRAGNLDIVVYLMMEGANINQQTSTGQTPLHLAIWKQHPKIVDQLLEAGAQVNIPDNVSRRIDNSRRNKDGWYPLHWACRNNMVVWRLVEAHARLDCLTKSGQTAVDVAYQYNNHCLAQGLLYHGAYINSISRIHAVLKAAGLSVEKIMDTVNSFIQHGYTIQNHDHWLNSGKIQALLTNHD